jgi:diguanylate cyclase (GGDEF)-like protein
MTSAPRLLAGAALVAAAWTAGAYAATAERARLRRALDAALWAAATDPLTGLTNRHGFDTQASTWLRAGVDEALVLLLDLDDFKAINDNLGHQVGDAVLTEIAHRLAAVAAPDGVAARLGGDEFVAVLPARAEPTSTVTAVRERLAEPMRVEAWTFAVWASIGVTVRPAGVLADGADLRLLLSQADAAMYRAKRGRLGVCFYHAQLDDGWQATPGVRPAVRRRGRVPSQPSPTPVREVASDAA